jgi:hypothetical protein
LCFSSPEPPGEGHQSKLIKNAEKTLLPYRFPYLRMERFTILQKLFKKG